ncbi:2,5-didehydrogluconate reductase DkgB [Pokkaliibacter sp. CJK22405]|uniref:2,5-didehydrogluconate reductase DkgB n=1 Tax=Pokkaliibacter sp. CJK22405 TaxID=3384615 RepID=UPI003984D8C9
MQIPHLGLGTFRLKGQTAYDSVASGLKAGYRHIDTAQIYGNEEEVGKAIADSGIPRDELFITTKIWTDKFAEGKLIPSLRESLDKLQVEKVDLTLIHWPSPDDKVPVETYMTQLAQAKEEGLTANIGVSNFTISHMKKAIDAVGAKAILTNQVELHPFLQNRPIVEFCEANGILLTAYMPLAYGKVMHEPMLKGLAEAYNTTPAVVALAWGLQQGYVVIPSSTKPEHQKINLLAKALEFTDEEMAALATLDRDDRLVSPDFGPTWD